MSDLDNGRISTLRRPTTDDSKAWKAYWEAQGQLWRTEPEIDAERQKFLAERRTIVPNIEKGIYPFKDIELSRADVEWLLATHESNGMRGPVDWSDEKQRHYEGLDLRGANLRNVNLSNMPLTRMRGGLNEDERIFATAEMADIAAIHLEGAILKRIHLERADLYKAQLDRVDLYGAYLEKTYLSEAHLTRANLYAAHLVRTQLRRAHLVETELQSSLLTDEKHIGPQLADAYWSNTNLSVLQWSNVKMLDDEYRARQKTRQKGRSWNVRDKDRFLMEYEAAVRANRQLAVVLQAQGLNEVA